MKRCKIVFSFLLCICIIASNVIYISAQNNIDLSNENRSEIKFKENSWRYSEGELIDSFENQKIQLFSVSWSKENGQFVNDRGEVINGATKKGIDVSSWQGTIDWEKVKNSDIDYAIIRCGYGDDLEKYDDSMWKRNAGECMRLGIPFGVYIYSYAASIEEAESEAAHVLRLVEGYDLKYPIYLDLEDNVVAACSNSLIGQIAQVFCSKIQDAGYDVGIYANLNWWNNKLTDKIFENKSWYRWIAQYNSTCTYSGEYTMWQCTSSGSVNGINGNVDLNFWYVDDINNLKGDVNFDGVVDAGDAGLILRHKVGLVSLNAMQLEVADIDGDGEVGRSDATKILDYDVNIINE